MGFRLGSKKQPPYSEAVAVQPQSTAKLSGVMACKASVPNVTKPTYNKVDRHPGASLSSLARVQSIMPLTYFDRSTSGTQLDIVSGKAIVGNLWKAALSVSSGGSVHWSWSWHAGPGSGPQQHGTADTIDSAKAQIEEQWRAWLQAAGLSEN